MHKNKWRLIRPLKNQNGQVLILVLLFVTLGILLVPPLLSLAFTVNKSANLHQIRTSGVYAADSGVQDAYWQLLQPFPDLDKVPLATSTLPYSISDMNNKQINIQISIIQNNAPDYMVYKVESTATGDGSNNKIDVYVKNNLGKIGLGDNAIMANSTIIFSKNNSSVASIVDANGNSSAIWANGNIIFDHDDTEIYGNVWTAGHVVGDPDNIYGNTYEGVPQHAMVEIDFAPFILAADAARINGATAAPPSFFDGGGNFDGSFCITGSLDITDDTTIDGDVFVNGDLTVQANIQVNGALYITNDLIINTGNTPDDLTTAGTIYVGGDLNIEHSNAALKNQHAGAIVIEGNVTLDKWCIGPDYTLALELPTIMMHGTSFSVGSNNYVRAFIYAPNAAVDFTNAASSGLEGAVIAGSVTLGNQNFLYRNDILGNAYGGFGQQSHGTPDVFTMEKWHLN